MATSSLGPLGKERKAEENPLPGNTWTEGREKFWGAELCEDEGPATDGRGVIRGTDPLAQRDLSP